MFVCERSRASEVLPIFALAMSVTALIADVVSADPLVATSAEISLSTPPDAGHPRILQLKTEIKTGDTTGSDNITQVVLEVDNSPAFEHLFDAMSKPGWPLDGVVLPVGASCGSTATCRRTGR